MSMTSKKVSAALLKDVVAYVDVWSTSKTENYSDPFIQQLRDMGAQVCKTFNKQVTHVVFKHGHQATWNKAKKMGVKMVSVHWVASCKENNEHADEDLFPAHNEESQLSRLKKITHRCMQPRDMPVSTPKRLKRKLDKMMEELGTHSKSTSDGLTDSCTELSSNMNTKRIVQMDKYMKIGRLQQHLSAGEHQDLFREEPLIFVSSLSQPPCHSLTELILLRGGTVCRSVLQASICICIGEYKGKKPEGAK